MAQWYHRNGLKNTAPHTFTLPMVSAHPNAIQICTALAKSRARFLQLVADPASNAENVQTELNTYLSLLGGFVLTYHLDKSRAASQSSKLRHITVFKWSNSVSGTVDRQQDSVFELISICYEFALWLMKSASSIASQESVDMETAKSVHTALRKAAGVLTFVQTQWTEQLLEKPIAGSDLDPRMLATYITTCQAEAQEVTIARAIELKHSASLISALANQTAQMFLASAASLKSLEAKFVGKWLAYLHLKAEVYESYAYCYLGENLLAQEKCGEATRALEESERHFQLACKACRDYGQLKLVVKNGMAARIDEHLFFRNLRPLVARTKEKCERENGFIFHQKVPKDCPPLELKATHGLVTPEDFSMPGLHELWTVETYSSFDLNRGVTEKKKEKSAAQPPKETKNEPAVEEIKEKPIKTSIDQKNESGCSIS